MAGRLRIWEFVKEWAGVIQSCHTDWTRSGFLAKQIAIVGLPWDIRKIQAKALLFSSGLYGVEVHQATQQHVEGVRRAVGYAMWQNKGPRNRLACLLLLRMDPWVDMCGRILGHWWRQAAGGYFDCVNRAEYWEACKGMPGRVRGLVHQIVRLSLLLGFHIEGGSHIWTEQGKTKVVNISDWKERVASRAADVMWKKLATSRFHFGGLETGLDDRCLEFGKKNRKWRWGGRKRRARACFLVGRLQAGDCAHSLTRRKPTRRVMCPKLAHRGTPVPKPCKVS